MTTEPNEGSVEYRLRQLEQKVELLHKGHQIHSKSLIEIGKVLIALVNRR